MQAGKAKHISAAVTAMRTNRVARRFRVDSRESCWNVAMTCPFLGPAVTHRTTTLGPLVDVIGLCSQCCLPLLPAAHMVMWPWHVPNSLWRGRREVLQSRTAPDQE